MKIVIVIRQLPQLNPVVSFVASENDLSFLSEMNDSTIDLRLKELAQDHIDRLKKQIPEMEVAAYFRTDVVKVK